MQSYCSNILFKQEFPTSSDVFISFLANIPVTNFLLLQNGIDKLLFQDGRGRMMLQQRFGITGLGVFLVDSNVPYLTGGGKGGTAGCGLITDENNTALSAVSGMLLNVMYDPEGIYGLSGSLAQFGTGNEEPMLSSFAVRKLSTFEFIESVPISAFDYPFNDNWACFRFGFKDYMQTLTIYAFNGDKIYTELANIDTGINIDMLPQNVRVGITWSGTFGLSIKNVAINGGSL